MLEFSLKEHRFVLRPLEQADVEAYLVFFNALSEESIRCRFGHLLASLTASTAKQRLHGNTESEQALAIFDQPQGRIVAVGRCYLGGKDQEAEVAFVVSEAMRRLGLGRFLLQQLIGIAQDGGSTSISAFIATRNAPVVHLLRSAGFVVQPANGQEDVKLVLTVAAPGQS